MREFDIAAFARGLRPGDDLTISEWADLYRVLPGKTSAEPGPWRTDRFPFLREIMDTLSPQHPAERVVFMKGTQIGATEAGNNMVLYYIDHEPSPIMMVLPTLDVAKDQSKIRVAPMIETCAPVRDKIAPARTRDSGNAQLLKDFEGGYLALTGANSAAGLKSKPIRILFADECDEYPADVAGQGDPIKLAEARTDTFAGKKKIYIPSTPTAEYRSKIKAEFMKSDQRYYFVPCPKCGEYQTITWDKIKWDRDELGNHLPETVRMECAECGAAIPESAKTVMLRKGEWRPTAAGDGKTVGYHLSALYSPLGFYSWEQAARDFLEAKAARVPLLLKTFINTKLGETWQEHSESTDPELLMARREEYSPAEMPPGVCILTAGVDVQDDRLEAAIIGWGRDHESWRIEHRVFHGDPGMDEVWNRLDDFLLSEYEHPAGIVLRVAAACVDTGGHYTDNAYKFCKPRYARRVYAIKGAGGAGRPIAVKSTKKVGRRHKVHLFTLGVDGIKDLLYSRLKVQKVGPGYWHVPGEDQISDEYLEQVCAEKRIKEEKKDGTHRWVWHKTRANEALDLEVYSIAALGILGVDPNDIAHQVEVALDDAESGEEPPPAQPQRTQPRRRARGGYVTGWRG